MKKRPTPNDERGDTVDPNSEACRESGTGQNGVKAPAPAKKRVVLFVGAGVSSPLVPTSSGFVDKLQEMCLDDTQIKEFSHGVKLCEHDHEHIITINNLLGILCFDHGNQTIEDLFMTLDKLQDVVREHQHGLCIKDSSAKLKDPDRTELCKSITRSYSACIDNIHKILNSVTPASRKKDMQAFTSRMITRHSTHHPQDARVMHAKSCFLEHSADMCCLYLTIGAVRQLIERFVYSRCLVFNPRSWSEHGIPPLLNYENFFWHLDRKNISLTIATTNYDLVIESFAQMHNCTYYDGFINGCYCGFDHGHTNNEQFLLLKLHGSVNWSLKKGETFIDSKKLKEIKDFVQSWRSSSRNVRKTLRSKFLKHPIATLDHKLLIYYGIKKNPAHKDIFLQFQRDITSADLVIVAGYSFSDVANNQLLDCIKIAADNNKLCVIDPNPNMQNTLESLGIHVSQSDVLNYCFKDFAMEEIFSKIYTKRPWVSARFLCT